MSGQSNDPYEGLRRYKLVIEPAGMKGGIKLIDLSTGATILEDRIIGVQIQVDAGKYMFTTATITIPVEVEADVASLHFVTVREGDNG